MVRSELGACEVTGPHPSLLWVFLEEEGWDGEVGGGGYQKEVDLALPRILLGAVFRSHLEGVSQLLLMGRVGAERLLGFKRDERSYDGSQYLWKNFPESAVIQQFA